MKKNMTGLPRTIISIITSLIFYTVFGTGCSIFKPKFDPEGYQYAVTIRDESSVLIKKATESYEKHEEEVNDLMTRVEQAYEHARLMRKNKAVIGLWNQMRDLEGNRLGKFMEEWKTEDILDEKTIKKYSKWIESDLETLVEIENKKKK